MSVERLLIRIDATTEQLRRELKRAEASVDQSSTRMQRAINKMGGAWKGADKWVQRHNSQIKLLGAAAVGATGLAVRAIADYSDTYKNLQGQLRLVTGTQEELNDVWTESLDIANGTGVSLESTVTLYARMARATEELGVSQSDLLGITDTINKAFVVSGATAQESSAAIVQLSQAMAKGRLDGQELNAILEQSPRLARLIAVEMDAPIGALKDLGSQGKITSEIMISAFENGADAVDEEFAKMPITVGRAMNEVQNQLLNAFGKADLEPLTQEIQRFGEVLKDPEVIDGLTALASGLVSMTTSAAKLVATLPGLTKFLAEELASSSGIAADDMDRMAEKIEWLKDQTARYADEGEKVPPIVKQQREELKKLQLVYELNLELMQNAANATKDAGKETQKLEKIVVTATRKQSALNDNTEDYTDNVDDLVKSLESLSARHEKANESITDGIKAIDDINRETEQYIGGLEFELSLIGRSAREQAVLSAARDGGARATAAQRAEIERLTGEIYDANAAMEASEESQERMTQAIESARSELSDFFFELAADGNSAFDTLVDGFQAMINKMLAEFAASGLIGLFQGKGLGGFDLGGTDAGGFISQIAGGGQVQQGLSLAGTANSAAGFLQNPGSILDSLKSIPDSVASFFDDVSLTGGFTTAPQAAALPGGGSSVVVRNAAGDVVDSGVGAAAPGGVNFAQIGAGIAAGFVGNLAGNALFDNEGSTGVGSAVGGIAGGIFGGGSPLGVGIGSFLGEGVEKVLGDLLGFGGAPGANKGIAEFDFSRDLVEGSGIGKEFDQKNVDLAVGIAELGQTLAQALGGSTASGTVTASASRGFVQLGSQAEGNQQRFKGEDRADKAIEALFQQVVAGAESLDPSLKQLLLGFEGTGEQSILFADAILASVGPQQALSASMAELIAEVGGAGEEAVAFTGTLLALTDAEQTVSDSIQGLLRDFEGTGEETARLAGVLLNLSTEGSELSDSVSTLIGDFRGTGDEVSSFAAVLLGLTDSSDTVSSSVMELIQGVSGSAEAVTNFTGELLSTIDATEELDDSFVDLVLGFKGSTDQSLAFTRALLGLDTAAKAVDETTRELIEGFEGAPDSLVTFTEALVGIRGILDSNPVGDAVANFEASLSESGNTIAGAFIQQAFHVKALAQEYDGSAAATVNLQNALSASSMLAGEFATVLERTKQSIAGLTETTADYFRVSTLSEAELQDKQVARLNELEDILESTLDPQVLESAFGEYTSLSREVFDNLTDSIDPAKFKAFGEEFAVNIETFGSLVQDKLIESGEALEDGLGMQFDLVDSMLSVHAASYQDSAEKNRIATEDFARAVDRMDRVAQTIERAGTSFAQPQRVSLTVNGQRVSSGSEISV